MSDADEFMQRRSGLPERRQYNFEEKVIRKILTVLHPSPGQAVGALKQAGGGPEGLVFWQFHDMFPFPMALAGYKLRRLDFLRTLRDIKATPLWPVWTQHLSNYSTEYHGLFYESIGDGLPQLLLHNCTNMRPYIDWRCELTPKDWGFPLYIMPIDGALNAFINMGWKLE